MSDTSIATAADYADAMLAARRAKNWLFLILLVLLLLQLSVFFMYRFGVIDISGPTTFKGPMVTTAATTRALTVQGSRIELLLTYLIGLCDFLGIVLVIVLALVLLLVVNIMLVGRLIGVGRLTSACISTLLLMVLLFPWQAFLGNYAFKIPGVLYTWDELLASARWGDVIWQEGMLHWTRFVVMPLIALILLMRVQILSTRGIRQALGEAIEV